MCCTLLARERLKWLIVELSLLQPVQGLNSKSTVETRYLYHTSSAQFDLALKFRYGPLTTSSLIAMEDIKATRCVDINE